MKKYLKILVLAAASVILCSCVGNNNQNNIDMNLSEETAYNDTTLQEAESTTEEDSGLKFDDANSAVKWMKESGHWDEYKNGILLQMAVDQLDYATKLLENEYPRFIIVDKAKMKVFLYDKYGRIEKNYGMACAKNFGTKHRRGDSRTSEGFFSAEGIYDSTEWLFTDDNGYTSPAKGQFGPRFIRVDIPTTRSIGIHGTAAPGSIGGRRSHGCIRLTNENILELVKYVEKGMPIIISPGPKDMAVNEKEGYYVPSVATEVGIPRAIPAIDYGHANHRDKSVESQRGSNATQVSDSIAGESAKETEIDNEEKTSPITNGAPANSRESSSPSEE